MKQFKQYVYLFIVLALIGAGLMLLIVDSENVEASWKAIGAALVCFAAGLYLGFMFDRKNLLPE